MDVKINFLNGAIKEEVLMQECYTSTLLALISVASVACCSQVSQVSSKEYCHDVYVILITTLRRHLKCLKHLI
jgi:hypothetical protein